MPRLHVLAAGARLPDWAQAACADYARRMPKGYEVAQLAPKPGRLRAALPRNARIVALDERGEHLTTVQFAQLLKAETAFVIGGPDGLEPDVKKDAFLLLRLSSLTLPHALAQVVLMEQLYRAATLLIGHPYHRD